MSDTPRTDELLLGPEHYEEWRDMARQLDRELSVLRSAVIEECAKVCDPVRMSVQDYVAIKNHVMRRDIDRDYALQKNLAKAIRALSVAKDYCERCCEAHVSVDCPPLHTATGETE